jgi:hypothetical protein
MSASATASFFGRMITGPLMLSRRPSGLRFGYPGLGPLLKGRGDERSSSTERSTLQAFAGTNCFTMASTRRGRS